jgi:hypothetical protein
MEKMDSERVCHHQKVHEQLKSTDRTNAVAWICRLCGREGVDIIEGFQDPPRNEFAELQAKKKAGGFHAGGAFRKIDEGPQ